VRKRGKFELGDQVVSESGSTFGRISGFAPGLIFVEDHATGLTVVNARRYWHHDPDGPGRVRHRAVTDPDIDAPDGAVVAWAKAYLANAEPAIEGQLLDDDGVWVDTGVPARPEQKT
jgi:hypothetical protein